jgi:hypothetical protein
VDTRTAISSPTSCLRWSARNMLITTTVDRDGPALRPRDEPDRPPRGYALMTTVCPFIPGRLLPNAGMFACPGNFVKLRLRQRRPQVQGRCPRPKASPPSAKHGTPGKKVLTPRAGGQPQENAGAQHQAPRLDRTVDRREP